MCSQKCSLSECISNIAWVAAWWCVCHWCMENYYYTIPSLASFVHSLIHSSVPSAKRSFVLQHRPIVLLFAIVFLLYTNNAHCSLTNQVAPTTRDPPGLHGHELLIHQYDIEDMKAGHTVKGLLTSIDNDHQHSIDIRMAGDGRYVMTSCDGMARCWDGHDVHLTLAF